MEPSSKRVVRIVSAVVAAVVVHGVRRAGQAHPALGAAMPDDPRPKVLFALATLQWAHAGQHIDILVEPATFVSHEFTRGLCIRESFHRTVDRKMPGVVGFIAAQASGLLAEGCALRCRVPSHSCPAGGDPKLWRPCEPATPSARLVLRLPSQLPR